MCGCMLTCVAVCVAVYVVVCVAVYVAVCITVFVAVRVAESAPFFLGMALRKGVCV